MHTPQSTTSLTLTLLQITSTDLSWNCSPSSGADPHTVLFIFLKGSERYKVWWQKEGEFHWLEDRSVSFARRNLCSMWGKRLFSFCRFALRLVMTSIIHQNIISPKILSPPLTDMLISDWSLTNDSFPALSQKHFLMHHFWLKHTYPDIFSGSYLLWLLQVCMLYIQPV